MEGIGISVEDGVSVEDSTPKSVVIDVLSLLLLLSFVVLAVVVDGLTVVLVPETYITQ